MDLISSYKKSLYSAWGYNDYNDWPIKFNSIMHLFVKEFSEEFENDLKEVLKTQKREQVSHRFKNPARIYRIIHSIIYGMKLRCISLEEQREMICLLLQMTSDLKVGDIFNKDGRNIIYVDNSLFSGLNYTHSDTLQSASLQRFFGLMWAYTESLFFRAHDVTKEIHGLYYENDQKILVREYYNLQPKEIWGEMRYVDYSSLKVIAYYSKELDISLDAYNHIFFKKGNYIENMIKYRIEADGKEITIEQLLEQVPNMEECIRSVHDWTERVTSKHIINRYADIYWYRKKVLKDLLDKDWRVPINVREQIEQGDIDQRRMKKLSDRQIEFMINTLA